MPRYRRGRIRRRVIQPVSIYCRCPCHEPGGETIRHPTPCCVSCPRCGKHITLVAFERHFSRCHPGTAEPPPTS